MAFFCLTSCHSQAVLSRADAIRLAAKELRDPPPSYTVNPVVAESPRAWMVSFAPREQTTGGGSTIVLNKSDGRVLMNFAD